MRSPDTPPDHKSCDSQPTKRQPLYIRLYFEPVYTELARFIGYGGKPMVEAQQFVLDLEKKYGRQKVIEAGEAISTAEGKQENMTVRLTAEARRVAWQLLGPPPEHPEYRRLYPNGKPGDVPASATKNPPSPEKPSGAPQSTAAPKKRQGSRPHESAVTSCPRLIIIDSSLANADETEGRNVRLPRRAVLERFRAWLEEQKLTFVVAQEAQPTSDPLMRLGALDFVVHQDGRKLLITLRSALRARDRADMLRWRGAFGPGHTALRVWPVEGKVGWTWHGHPIEADPPDAPPEATDVSDRVVGDIPDKGEQPIGGSPVVAPLLQQYREAKERHPGMLLLFRVADFYELFDEDAEIAAKLLGLTLTTRDRTIAMSGFPYHCLENYLRKLLQAGHRVAVCEQVTETVPTRPIRREVTRVVTPGTMDVEAPAAADTDIPSRQHEIPSDADQSGQPDSPSTPAQPRPHAAARKQFTARRRQGRTGDNPAGSGF